jgi:hypothetical protein
MCNRKAEKDHERLKAVMTVSGSATPGVVHGNRLLMTAKPGEAKTRGWRALMHECRAGVILSLSALLNLLVPYIPSASITRRATAAPEYCC